MLRRQQLEGSLSVARLGHLVADRCQCRLEHQPNVRLVIDDQDALL